MSLYDKANNVYYLYTIIREMFFTFKLQNRARVWRDVWRDEAKQNLLVLREHNKRRDHSQESHEVGALCKILL